MERPFIPVLMFALLLAGCGRAPEQEWTDLAGDLEDCLVVVFRLNSDPRAVYSFLEQHTTVPDPRGGRAFRAGIGSIVQVGVGEHDAYKVCFWPAATREQRAAVWRGMSSRPLVEGLYEDVDNARIGVGAARSE